eukprot:Sdes_comp20660_c0_seq1m15972
MGPGTHFEPVLVDECASREQVKKLLFVSGKAYYEFEKKRVEDARNDIAFIRLEELCPFPSQELKKAIAHYPSDCEKVWVQEEPENMGAWSFVEPRFREQLGIHLKYVGRKSLSVPAIGATKLHQKEVSDLLETIFTHDVYPKISCV